MIDRYPQVFSFSKVKRTTNTAVRHCRNTRYSYIVYCCHFQL